MTAHGADFGCRNAETINALERPASEKRQGTKSQGVGADRKLAVAASTDAALKETRNPLNPTAPVLPTGAVQPPNKYKNEQNNENHTQTSMIPILRRRSVAIR
jgi:hypothetical protein